MFTGHDPKCPFDDPGLVRVCVCGLLMETRAIERERVAVREADKHIATVAWNRQAVLSDLHAKVEALDWWIDDQHAIDPLSTAVILRSDVLDLFDGGSDE